MAMALSTIFHVESSTTFFLCQASISNSHEIWRHHRHAFLPRFPRRKLHRHNDYQRIILSTRGGGDVLRVDQDDDDEDEYLNYFNSLIGEVESSSSSSQEEERDDDGNSNDTPQENNNNNNRTEEQQEQFDSEEKKLQRRNLQKWKLEQQHLMELRSTFLSEALAQRGIPLTTLMEVSTPEGQRKAQSVDWDCCMSTQEQPKVTT
jgi:hypothetical protein